MVTVVLYAQPSRDEEKEPRLEKIESIEGFESFEIMGKKLSMFQIIGVVFAVTFLALLIWSTYRKRARDKRIKEGAKKAIETYQTEIQNTQLLTSEPYKTAVGTRSGSIEGLIKNKKVENTLQTVKDKALESVSQSTYTPTEKTAIKQCIREDFNKNYDQYTFQLVQNVARTVGVDVKESAGQKIDAMLKPLSEYYNVDAGTIGKSAYNEELNEDFKPKQVVVPKRGFLTRLFGRS